MIAREQLPVSALAADVAAGLRKTPKSLPPWLFYDAQGSALFEEITRLPEYYLTRTERSILEDSADQICRLAGTNVNVVELGAGTASKTRIVLRAMLRRQLRVHYVPIDVSRTALQEAQDALRRELPRVIVKPIIADYASEALHLRDLPGRKLILYLGSSIGNFDPVPAIELLARVRGELRLGDALLLGADRVKPEEILVPAYDDAAGITEMFNKNMLARMNRELGANFELQSFRHIARWNPTASRMEIYLESSRRQSVYISTLGMRVSFEAGERIHTENSYKYTDESVQGLLASSGFGLKHTFTDERGWFGLYFAQVA